MLLLPPMLMMMMLMMMMLTMTMRMMWSPEEGLMDKRVTGGLVRTTGGSSSSAYIDPYLTKARIVISKYLKYISSSAYIDLYLTKARIVTTKIFDIYFLFSIH